MFLGVCSEMKILVSRKWWLRFFRNGDPGSSEMVTLAYEKLCFWYVRSDGLGFSRAMALDGFQERVRVDLKKGFSAILRKYRDGESDLIRQIYFTQFVVQ